MAITVTVKIDEDQLRESISKIVAEMRDELQCSCQQRPADMTGPGWIDLNVCPCGWKPRAGVIGGETLEEHQRWCAKAPKPAVETPPWLILLGDEAKPYTINISQMNIDEPAHTLEHLYAMRDRNWSAR